MSDLNVDAILQELRELIVVGLDEAKCGELLDGEQVMADLLRRHEESARREAGNPGA